MSPEKPSDAPDEQPSSLRENPEVDDFFHRLPSNLRWPKPDAEAVAAAVDAIQRLAGGGPVEQGTGTLAESGLDTSACAGCHQVLAEGARFCPNCGLPAGQASSAASPAAGSTAGQHHYHHHYHHFVPSKAAGVPLSPEASAAGQPAPRASGSVAKSAPGSRAESAARQLVRDWVQACNTKHLDDLLELYTADATLIRSNVPPVRSLPAIREFVVSLLEAGLGDVEMEPLRTEVLGEVALEFGRCKMLVPVAMGKRREERGKYMVVLVRQPAGNWKILADCWSSDLAAGTPAADTVRKIPDVSGPVRKPR